MKQPARSAIDYTLKQDLKFLSFNSWRTALLPYHV